MLDVVREHFRLIYAVESPVTLIILDRMPNIINHIIELRLNQNSFNLVSTKITNQKLPWNSCPKVPLICILAKLNRKVDKRNAALACKSSHTISFSVSTLWSNFELDIAAIGARSDRYRQTQNYLKKFRTFISSITYEP